MESPSADELLAAFAPRKAARWKQGKRTQLEQFVTYLVFEDAAGALTSLGWMNWKWSARALLGHGDCPPASAHPDCTRPLTGAGSKLGESFAPGAIGPQALNRATAAVSMLSSSCPPGNCPVTAPAAAPSSTTGRHAE